MAWDNTTDAMRVRSCIVCLRYIDVHDLHELVLKGDPPSRSMVQPFFPPLLSMSLCMQTGIVYYMTDLAPEASRFFTFLFIMFLVRLCC